MIQDIYPHRFSLDYQVCAPREGDPVIIFQDNQVFLTQDHTYPLYGKEITEGEREGAYQFLSSIDGQKYFLALELPPRAAPAWKRIPSGIFGICVPCIWPLRAIRPGICTPGTRITGSAEDADRNSCTTERCGCYSVPHAATRCSQRSHRR